MKQIILGDIHGHITWSNIVDKHKDVDRIIFLGDYFDSFSISGQHQLINFQNICNFARTSGKEVILLTGNHDHHYKKGVEDFCSGYKPHMRPSFELALEDNEDLMKMCFVDEYNNVYSHAGITSTWLENVNIQATDIQGIVSEINEFGVNQPKVFNFYSHDYSGYGNNINQSCIWVRPDALYKDSIDYFQVVGHTPQGNIDFMSKADRRGFALIDCLHNGQYLSCTNGQFQIERL